MKRKVPKYKSLFGLLTIALLMQSQHALAVDQKVTFAYGYYSINAKASGETSNIANPYYFHFSYHKKLTRKIELKAGYNILMADLSGSDMGYGLDVGANYFFLTPSLEQSFRDQRLDVIRVYDWLPYVGVSFNQRNFQSVRNSYAGMAVSVGSEKYYNEKMNFKGEFRYASMGGTGESTATEMSIFGGLVYKF
jgi:hypothetical protein